MTTEIKPRTVYQLVRTDKPDDGTDVYVGSTSLSLKKRLELHKTETKRVNSKLYTRMSEIGIYNWKIVPLLIHVCNQKEIRSFERQWIALLSPDLNTYSPLANNYETRCRQVDRVLYHNNIENKRYYCELCDKSFGHKCALKKHLKSLKHSYAYMNSVD